jgi:membrane peptidoglycan carboxypeptidase
MWIGNDVHIELSQGSSAAARLWSKVMTRVMDGREVGEYPEQPDNVVKASVSGMSDYFIKGTKPSYVTTGKTKATICKDSGYLATPWCPHTKEKTYNTLNGDESDAVSGSAPKYYCNLHNSKPGKYPIDPDKKLNKDFDPKDPDGSKKKKKEEEEKKKKEAEEQTDPAPTPDPVVPTPTPEPTPTPTPDPATSSAAVSLRFGSLGLGAADPGMDGLDEWLRTVFGYA